jgi:hypothetical protein
VCFPLCHTTLKLLLFLEYTSCCMESVSSECVIITLYSVLINIFAVRATVVRRVFKLFFPATKDDEYFYDL